jgi:hypothetical protein
VAFVPRNFNAIGVAAESFSCPKQLDVARKDGQVGLGTSGLEDFRRQLPQSDEQNLNCTIRSDRNQMVSDRILHQFGIALGVKNFHDAVFVKSHGASCKV